MRASRFTHVIFDLDGTLLDTEPLYAVAAQRVLARYGKTYDVALKRRIMGGGALVGARVVIEALGLPLQPREYVEQREAHLRELFQSVAPRPGAQALVESLAARGVPLAIGTSSSRELCELKLRSHPWAEHFSAIVCSDDPGVTAAKPAPDIFLTAARRLGASPESCLVFEDTPTGVRAALAAGMSVMATPDLSVHEQGDFAGALGVVESLLQLDLAMLGW